MLDEAPHKADESILTPIITKNIIGQSVFQLMVMAWILGPGTMVLHVDKPTQYTMLFNTFVMMQLFNQVTVCLLFLLHAVGV